MEAERLSALYANERERIKALKATSKLAADYDAPVFGEGPLNAGLLLLGEAPGANEAEAGKPFIGKAGKQLDELLALANIPRAGVFVTNAVKYRPVNIKAGRTSNRTPIKREVVSALPLLESELLLVRPRLIATLGNTPLSAIGKLSGLDNMTIGACHGGGRACKLKDHEFVLFPLYHPASAIYNRSLLDTMQEDIIELGRVYSQMKGGVPL